jgi:putative ABC transport system permease protein
MMDLRETLSVAIDALRGNKLRAILTSLGVIIGSASIVLVVTVALTSRKFVISQIEGIGSNLVWAELIHAGTKGQPLSYEITVSDMDAVKGSVPGVQEVAGTRELPMSVIIGGAERPVNLIGVTEGFQAIRRLVIIRGRYFDSADMETRSKVCLVTRELSDRVFGLENPIGGTIRMGELTFTVIRDYSAHADEVLHRSGCAACALRASHAPGRCSWRRTANGAAAAKPPSH